MIANLEQIYCLADNFVKFIEKEVFKKSSVGRKGMLTRAEYLTIAIIKQDLGIKTNKKLYKLIKFCMQNAFSTLPSYSQFISGMNSNLLYLVYFLQIHTKINQQNSKGLYFVDSTPMPICSNAHRYAVKTDLGSASAGKNMNGWFYGYKLHLIINHNMDIVSFKFTTGSTNDTTALDEKLIKDLQGYLIGDKGYISSKKKKELAAKGLLLMTKPRKNMKQPPATPLSIALFKCRMKIESIFGTLKHEFSLINRYARSITGYFTQALAALVTYCLKNDEQYIYLMTSFEELLIS